MNAERVSMFKTGVCDLSPFSDIDCGVQIVPAGLPTEQNQDDL